jgi:hypothetical protein
MSGPQITILRAWNGSARPSGALQLMRRSRARAMESLVGKDFVGRYVFLKLHKKPVAADADDKG